MKTKKTTSECCFFYVNVVVIIDLPRGNMFFLEQSCYTFIDVVSTELLAQQAENKTSDKENTLFKIDYS